MFSCYWFFVFNCIIAILRGSLLSTHADRLGVDIAVTVSTFACLLACTVTYFSAEDKASGVKFCTAVHRLPRQGIFHFQELCSLETPQKPKIGRIAPASPAPRRATLTCSRATRMIGMCGYTAVPDDGRTCCYYYYYYYYYYWVVMTWQVAARQRHDDNDDEHDVTDRPSPGHKLVLQRSVWSHLSSHSRVFCCTFISSYFIVHRIYVSCSRLPVSRMLIKKFKITFYFCVTLSGTMYSVKINVYTSTDRLKSYLLVML